MPTSLRERLQQVSEHPNDYFHRYRMFEALVEAVEPENIDATICELREERDQATGERENLLESRRWWKQRCMNAEHERDEAKATLKREREEADIVFGIVQEQRNDAIDALEERDTELARVSEEIERLRPLAEIGRLVRGMRQDSRLVKGIANYWGGLRDDKGSWQTIILPIHLDPIKALHQIQEVGDE